MSDFTVPMSEQPPVMLQAFRKQAGLTQAETALRLGMTQLERKAEKVSADRLMRPLSVLGVELVLRKNASGADMPLDSTKPMW